MEQSLKGKHIVVGISGGIAAYKTAVLVRLLVKLGAEVQVIMTPNAREFITPVTLSTLSGRPVITEFFTANSGEWHSHVSLGLWADLMIVAPATASTIAKMATGVADNMLVTTYLSAKEKVMVAPAMDLDMWAHPTTVRNIKILETDGVDVIYPASGELASHLHGAGRMQEPEIIAQRIEAFFHKAEPLKGKKVAITAGPTHERLDPVRYIGNDSTGKMGFALAEEFASRGAEVTLIAGPVVLDAHHPNITRIDVRDAKEMFEAAKPAFETADYGIFTAAVADYRPAEYSSVKMKREGSEELTLKLVRNPDIAASCSYNKREDQVFAGFALETDHEEENARKKLISKNLDAVVMNSLRDSGAGFGTETNKVTVYFRDRDALSLPLASKREIAKGIADALTGMR